MLLNNRTVIRLEKKNAINKLLYQRFRITRLTQIVLPNGSLYKLFEFNKREKKVSSATYKNSTQEQFDLGFRYT